MWDFALCVAIDTIDLSHFTDRGVRNEDSKQDSY